MNKFLKKVGSFFLTISILYLFLLQVFTFVETNVKGLNFFGESREDSRVRVENFQKEDSINMVFLGSSHCFMGINPRVIDKIGVKSYNLGTYSQTPVQSLYLYKRFLSDVPLKGLIIEVNPLVFDNDGAESNIDLFKSMDTDFDLLKMSIKSKNFKVINTCIHELTKIHTPSSNHYESSSAEFTLYQGFYKAKGFNKDTKDKYFIPSSIPKTENIDALKELVRLLNLKGVPYLLVQAPVTKGYYKELKDLENFEQKMSRLGNFINYQNHLDLDDINDFTDYHHLNYLGANKFSKVLGEDIITVLTK